MNKKKILLILAIIMIIIACFTVFFLFKNNIKNNTKYIKSSNRDNYIINDVDENFLKNYIINDKILVAFIATWCPHCVEEADDLNRFIVENPDKNILVISHDFEKSELEKFLDEKNYKWQVIFDKDKTIRNTIDPGASGIPCSYVLDKNMNILSFHSGKLNYEEFIKLYNLED